MLLGDFENMHTDSSKASKNSFYYIVQYNALRKDEWISSLSNSSPVNVHTGLKYVPPFHVNVVESMVIGGRNLRETEV